MVLAAVLVGIFLREAPLRQVHDLEGEPLPAEAEPRVALSPAAVAPVAGGANGGTRRRPLILAVAGAGATLIAGLFAFLIRRAG